MRATLPKIPQSVERTLGPEAAGDLGQWIEIIVVEHAVRRDEYREVLSRLDILEHDVVDLKDRITDLHHTMDERFDRMNAEMNQRFDRMNTEMNQRFDRMNERFDQMYERMTTMIRWTVGTLALLGTIMTILMAIAQFT
jgi:tetrahydromethanopterin S-methyltransferase subunit G